MHCRHAQQFLHTSIEDHFGLLTHTDMKNHSYQTPENCW